MPPTSAIESYCCAIFAKFLLGPTHPQSGLQGCLFALCSRPPPYHHHFGGCHKPPQWAPVVVLGSKVFTTLPAPHCTHCFDLGHCGPHLNQAHKSVPFSVPKQESKCLFVGLMLILWSHLSFSSLNKFL